MSGRNFNPADSGYVEVNKRIESFYEKHPQGSIQSQIVHLTDSLVVIKALAFRDPEDKMPGVGHSQMNIPGKTNFTNGSEVENAETSAWGRAIAALGFEVKKSIASANEIRNKADDAAPAEQTQPVAASGQPQPNRAASKERRDEIIALADSLGVTKPELGVLRKRVTDKAAASQFTNADADAMLKALQEAGALKQATGGSIV